MDDLVISLLCEEMMDDPSFDGDIDKWLDTDYPTTSEDLIIVEDI